MANIQKLWTSYTDLGTDGDQTTGATYIGQDGRLWFDPVTNAIRASDGNTPGGTIVTGGAGGTVAGSNTQVQFNNDGAFGASANFTFDGSNLTVPTLVSNTSSVGNLTISNETITGVNADQPINISPTGEATVNILNGISVYQGNFSTNPLFNISNTGVVSTLVPNAISYLGAFEIVGNPAGTTVTPQNFGVMLHTTGVADTASRIYNDGVNNYGVFINRRYNGTSASPTGVLANQIVGRVGATPYLLDGDWPSISSTRIDFIATEDQTTTQQGSEIQLWATEMGETDPVIVGQFEPGTILFTGDLHPNSTTSQYSLGNTTNKWGNLYLGPDSLFIEDSTLGTNAELTVNNGALLINGTQKLEIGNTQVTTEGISHTAGHTAEDLQIGTLGATGNTWIRNAGIRFADDTVQNTAAIPLIQRGNALGVATLDSGGKVPAAQLPAGAVVYKGSWDAATNTPTLADGTGSAGDEYSVGVAGTVNFGSGPITFAVGDFVIYSGTVWQKIPTAIGVSSFNTRTGAVTLTSSDVTTALSTGSITNTKLANSNVVINTGFGLGGGGTLNLGGSLSLTANVGNILGGTGVNVSASSGNYTVSIGQPVGTGNSVQFLAVSTTTTIQSTGNLSGGNVTTGGQVVAIGNITTSGAFITPNTTINSAVVTTGNVTGANLNTGGQIVATGNISGGNLSITGIANITGNLTAGNLAATNYTGLVTHGIRDAGVVAGALAINVTTDNIVKCTFSGDFTVSFTNIIAGRVVTLIATNTSAGDSDVITAGVAALNTTSGGTFTVTQQTTAVVTYYSLGTTTGNIYVAAVYA